MTLRTPKPDIATPLAVLMQLQLERLSLNINKGSV